MQFGQLKRREFITLLGGGAVAWPLTVRAQQPHVPVVGVLRPNRQDVLETFAEPFRRYMKAIGWEEGRNIRFLFAWMGGRNERATELAGELIAQKVDLIITFGDPAIRATQRATQAIPIVGMTDDMIGSGLAASLARPGGNTTGVSILASELDVKRLEILHEFVPQARRIALLVDTTTISTRAQLASAARKLGVELVPFEAQSPDEISRMLDAIATAKVAAVNVLGQFDCGGGFAPGVGSCPRANGAGKWSKSHHYGPKTDGSYLVEFRTADGEPARFPGARRACRAGSVAARISED
ncbi:MAG: ABC transporter substrate-binding protein [Xanthobacteraceae bacterium]